MKKIVAALIAFFLVLQFLAFPAPAQAQSAALAKVLSGTFQCVVDPLIDRALKAVGGFAVGLIKDIAGDSFNKFKDEAKKIGEKFLEQRGISTGEETVPTTVESDKPAEAKEIRDCVSAEFRRALIAAAVNDILEYVRNDNKPRFIQDYKEEFKRVADGTAANIIKDLSGVNICQPFRAQFDIIARRGVFADQFLSPAYFECTLTEAAERQEQALDYFYDDFRYGSWDTWIRLHESPNNELGFMLAVNDKRILETARAQEAAAAELAASGGFKNEQGCKAILIAGEGIAGESRRFFSPAIAVGGDKWNEVLRDLSKQGISDDMVTCAEFEIITPASVIAGQTNRSIAAEVENLINANSWFDVVKNLLNKSVTKILRDGLSAAAPDLAESQGRSTFTTPTPTTPEKPTLPPPVADPAAQTLICSASPTRATVNEAVTWSFETNLTSEEQLTQATGLWSYKWDFDDPSTFAKENEDVVLLGDDTQSTVVVSYETEGVKQARVFVVSPTGDPFQPYSCFNQVNVLTPEEAELN